LPAHLSLAFFRCVLDFCDEYQVLKVRGHGGAVREQVGPA